MKAKLETLTGHPAWRFGERLFQRFNDSRLPLLAAALAYYAAFSLGPLLLLLTGGVGFLLRSRPDLAADARLALINLVAQITPPQNDQVQTQLIEGSFKALEQLLVEGALVRSVVSLLILIWASSNFFSSLQLALELIFASPHPRNFWRKRLVAILLIFTAVMVILVEVIGGLFFAYLDQLVVLLNNLFTTLNVPAYLSLPELGGFLVTSLRVLITVGAFIFCFRFLPRRSSSWTGAVIGALFSAVSILVMREFLVSVFNLERFNLIYGVVTSLLVVLLWLYFAVLLFLVGALLAAEISVERRAARVKRKQDAEISRQ